jgi:excisionase family DNA binding protein
MDDFMTSAEAARLLGVGPTSVKRWSDAGLLACVRTAGKHRRFRREEVERFQREQGGRSRADATELDAWVVRLLGDADPHAIVSALLSERGRLGSWWRTADLVGELLVELGLRWQQGLISVLQEHLASEQLSRALARCCESIPVRSGAPRALLVSALSDEHTLGLQLAELCLRERGWNVLWAGHSVPEGEIEQRIREGGCQLLGLSAAQNLQDRAPLEDLVRRFGPACEEHGVALVLGGLGAWPEPAQDLPHFQRVRTFRELSASLEAVRG